jgi:uncharacterized coiled-coil DUF342 family protein
MSDDPFDARLAELNAIMDRTMAHLEAFHASIDDGALKRIEAGQTKMRGDVMERIDRLEDAVTGIRNDLTVTFGAADSVRRAHNNTRDEMRDPGESVSALYRKLARLETQLRELKGRTLMLDIDADWIELKPPQPAAKK